MTTVLFLRANHSFYGNSFVGERRDCQLWIYCHLASSDVFVSGLLCRMIIDRMGQCHLRRFWSPGSWKKCRTENSHSNRFKLFLFAKLLYLWSAFFSGYIFLAPSNEGSFAISKPEMRRFVVNLVSWSFWRRYLIFWWRIWEDPPTRKYPLRALLTSNESDFGSNCDVLVLMQSASINRFLYYRYGDTRLSAWYMSPDRSYYTPTRSSSTWYPDTGRCTDV